MENELTSHLVDSRRREQRQTFSAEATIQVMESADQELIGLTLDTTIVDVSTNGLRLACSRFLHECTLGIWIDLADESDNYFLAAAIRWASWHEGDGFQVGLELTDNPLSDQEKWNELWKTRLNLL